MFGPKGQCVCGGGRGAKAVGHDRNFCNFFNLNNFTVSNKAKLQLIT